MASLVTASGQLLRAVRWQPAHVPAGGVGNRLRWPTEPAERLAKRWSECTFGGVGSIGRSAHEADESASPSPSLTGTAQQ